MEGGIEKIAAIPADLPEGLRKYWGKEIVRYSTLPADEKRMVPGGLSVPEDKRELIEFSLSLIQEFLDLPIIEDKFKTDADRAAWRSHIETTDPEAFAAYENNMLRMNKIANALNGVENLLPFLEWTKLKGMGNLPEAHTNTLKETVRIWKKTMHPDTTMKISFLEDEVIPMLQHVFDAACETDFSRPDARCSEAARAEELLLDK